MVVESYYTGIVMGICFTNQSPYRLINKSYQEINNRYKLIGVISIIPLNIYIRKLKKMHYWILFKKLKKKITLTISFSALLYRSILFPVIGSKAAQQEGPTQI